MINFPENLNQRERERERAQSVIEGHRDRLQQPPPLPVGSLVCEVGRINWPNWTDCLLVYRVALSSLVVGISFTK